MTDISEKEDVRAHMLERRRRLSRETADAHGRAAAGRLPERLIAAAPAVVAGYRPSGGEIDPRPLMARFAAAGALLALPVTHDLGAPLAFRAYAPGDPLEADLRRIAAPTGEAPEVRPDVVITPLVAFDAAGRRLGRGGGHYDRTLAALRASGPVFALGLAYGWQGVDTLPSGRHDESLDAILTDAAFFDLSGGS